MRHFVSSFSCRMAALFRFLCFCLLTASSLGVVSRSTKVCTNKTAEECFLIERIDDDRISNMDVAYAKCTAYSRHGIVWSLPKQETAKERDDLLLAVFTATNLTNWTAWLGLGRFYAEDHEEAAIQSRWKNKSKWLWLIDGKALENEDQWAPNQPDNYVYRLIPKNETAKFDNWQSLENCVVMETTSNGSTANETETRLQWHDRLCSRRSPLSNLTEWVSKLPFLHVCQSMLQPPTTSTSTSTLKPQSTQAPTPMAQLPTGVTPDSKKAFPWQALLLGLCCVFAVVLAAIIGGLCYMKRKKKRAETKRPTTATKTKKDRSRRNRRFDDSLSFLERTRSPSPISFSDREFDVDSENSDSFRAWRPKKNKKKRRVTKSINVGTKKGRRK